MDCGNFETLSQLYIDEELDTERVAQFEAHLLTCDRCKREMEYLQATIQGIESYPQIEARADLADNVMARIEWKPSPWDLSRELIYIALHQRNFVLLWFGELAFTVGDMAMFIALPFYVYNRTSSVLATGAMLIVQTVPSLLFSSIAGVLIDRWNRKRIMVAADLLQALVLLPLFIVNSHDWLWIIYPVVFVKASIAQASGPAKSAIIPRFVGKKYLMKANSLNAIGTCLASLVGPSLGGLLLGLMGLNSVMFLGVASYVISGLLISLICLPSDATGEQAKTDNPAEVSWLTIWRDWLEGLQLVQREHIILAIFVVIGIGALGQGIIIVLAVVFIKDVLGAGAMEFGWLGTAQGLGALIGGFIIGQASRFLPPTRLITLGVGVVGIIFIVMINFPVLPLTLALTVLVGVPVMGITIGVETLLQSSTTDCYLGRIFGTYGTSQALLTLGGMGLASVLGGFLGVVPMLNVAGGLYFSAGLVALLMLRNKKCKGDTSSELKESPENV